VSSRASRLGRLARSASGQQNARMGLPTGTVTMLFSDMEGSTRLLARLGATYADLLSARRPSG
jgi:class 3 adenylate cyclase